jgi:hypothetical protein
MEEKLNALKVIAKTLNQNELTWALGGSLMMNLRGIKVGVNDIDIRVKEEDMDTIASLVSKLGTFEEVLPNKSFKTKRFIKVNLNGTTIDIMAGFSIVSQDQVHYYPIEDNSCFETMLLGNETIYLDDMLSWMTFYKLMNRMDKFNKIKRYLNLDK